MDKHRCLIDHLPELWTGARLKVEGVSGTWDRVETRNTPVGVRFFMVRGCNKPSFKNPGKYVLYSIPRFLMQEFPYGTPLVFDNSWDNMYYGLSERAGKLYDTGSVDALKFLDSFGTNILNRLPSAGALSLRELFDKYSGKKRARVIRGWEKFLSAGFDWDHTCKIFVKSEAAHVKSVSSEGIVYSAPRPIFNLPDAPNYLGARYYSPVEHIFLHLGPDLGYTRFIAKGLNSAQRGRLLRDKWEYVSQFGVPVAIGGDGRRADAHIHVGLLKVQHGWDAVISRYHQLLSKLQEASRNPWKLNFTVRGERLLEAFISAMRITGAWDTGGGNSLVHLMAFLSVLLGSGAVWEIVDDGDDVVVFTTLSMFKYVRKLLLMVEAYGVDFKWEDPVTIFEHIEFCRCHPVLCVDGWRMVRDPSRTINHFFFSQAQMPLKYALSYLKAQASGERMVFSGVPVLGPLFERCFVALAEEPEYKGTLSRRWVYDLERRRPQLEISEGARHSFMLAFGVMPHRQRWLEEQMGGILFSKHHMPHLKDPFLGDVWNPEPRFTHILGPIGPLGPP